MNRYGGGMGGSLPTGIKNLLYANGVMFVAVIIFPSAYVDRIYDLFAISYVGLFEQFRIWQPVSYMFLHGGFMHILFNMFALWMFGTELEYEWGTKKFLKFYFLTGIGAGLINLFFVHPMTPTVGASGAIFGLLAANFALWPDRIVYINFLFPVKMKYFVGVYVLISIFSLSGAGNVAHAAHLGGFLSGYIYLKYWSIYYKVKSFFQEKMPSIGNSSAKSNMKYSAGGSSNQVEYYRKKIDELLDKINKVGYLKLTDEEKKMLDEGSRYLREHDKKNFN